MELVFDAATHSYKTINNPDEKWISATSLIALFEEPFDADAISLKSSKNKKSKWYGKDPEDIKAFWNAEADRASTLGSWYHDQREQEVLGCETIQRNGLDLPVMQVHVENGLKHSPDQCLVSGIYPELFLYLRSAGACGQADRVEVVGDIVNIDDYKTYKKVDVHSYVNWEGKSKKMLFPLEHLDDCNLVHAALQLSIYMYIILKHNRNLKPGKLTIQHVTFAVERYDENGFPITAIDLEGNPIIEKVTPYDLPYLKDEVVAMFKYIQNNPQLIK
jgi:hypothetical protein